MTNSISTDPSTPPTTHPPYNSADYCSTPCHNPPWTRPTRPTSGSTPPCNPPARPHRDRPAPDSQPLLPLLPAPPACHTSYTLPAPDTLPSPRSPPPTPHRAQQSIYLRTQRGHMASRSASHLLHRWTPPPHCTLGSRWTPPPTHSQFSLPLGPPPPSSPHTAPVNSPPSTTFPTLIDLTGPAPRTSFYTLLCKPVKGIYHKVFRSLGTKHFPLHRPCFDPAHCL